MYVFLAFDQTLPDDRHRSFVHRSVQSDDANALVYAARKCNEWSIMYTVPYMVVLYSPDGWCVGDVKASDLGLVINLPTML